MATSKTLNVTLVTRNDTAAKWAESTYVLKMGEMGLDTTNNILKAGDGANLWADLPALNATCDYKPASHYEVVVEETDADDMAAIARVVGSAELHNDDICVVKHLIADDKYSYTAYVYNGTAWAAFDGNYNADNVYFDEDLIATENIGVIKTTNGSATIAAEGKSLEQVLKSILAEEKNPTTTAPSVSITFNFGAYEAGSTVTPTYTATLSAGKYTYGPATGITATAWEVTDNAGSEAKTTASGSFDAITVEDSTSYTVTAKATYDEGTVPVTNIGNEYADGQIAAGDKSKTSSAITAYRQYFYGMSNNTDALDSDAIRALTGSKAAYTASTTLDLLKAESVTGAKRAILAIPASQVTGSRTGLKSVIMPSAMNADITDTWVLQENTVDVEGTNGYTAIPYKVWIYQPASLDSTETYTIKLA